MKLVLQNFKTGTLSVGEAPQPQPHPNGVLVRTAASLVSVGTDRAIVGLAKKSYLGKALDRPDLARRVIRRARTEGPWSTYKVVQNLISEPLPLGYSLVGEVVAVAAGIEDLAVGDRVACAGLGYANHAEFVAVPRNLTAAVPAEVTDPQAAYTTLGAIAMHGVRQADQQMGACVLVVGLGLVGLLTVQLCRAAGYRVVGVDLDPGKLDLALQLGAEAALPAGDPQVAQRIAAITRGIGVDAVLLTAASRNSGAVFDQIVPYCRDRAKVVVVGDVKIELSRRVYFEKELEILQSRSYGPGRYDRSYEEGGRDYPVGYVRWTERRNMQAFLDLIATGALDPTPLTTHRFPLSEAEKAYDLVTGNTPGAPIGILIDYPQPEAEAVAGPPARAARRVLDGKVGLGVIGTGQYAKGILLPALRETGGFRFVGVASARGISAKAVSERYGADYAESDAQHILDDTEIQAVAIASRHDSHARYVIGALERGKHVFVEKPLCLNLEELSAVRAAEAASSGTLMVGFNRRFSPLLQAMGAHFAGCGEPLAMLYRINAGRIRLSAETAWVHDPHAGGGRIIGEACHFVDALGALCGARPVALTGSSANPRRVDLAGNDIASLTIDFDDGSIGTVHYWSNGDPSFPKERIEAFGAERIAVLHNFRTLELVAGGRTRKQRKLNVEKGFAEEAEAFLRACRSGEPAVDPQVWYDTMEVVLAAESLLRGEDPGASSPSEPAAR